MTYIQINNFKKIKLKGGCAYIVPVSMVAASNFYVIYKITLRNRELIEQKNQINEPIREVYNFALTKYQPFYL